MTFLDAFVGFLLGLAGNGIAAAVTEARKNQLDEALADQEALHRGLASRWSFRDELRSVCVKLAQDKSQFVVGPQEEPLWQLLSDEIFQQDLFEWFVAGDIEEGAAVRVRMTQKMGEALESAGASTAKIEALRTDYLDELDRALLSNPIIAAWRHQLSLHFLREQVAILRRRAEEAVGHYSPERQQEALESYRQKALDAWDIVDLSNLPTGDLQIATKRLLLRQLYVPLRLWIESVEHEDPAGTLQSVRARRDTLGQANNGWIKHSVIQETPGELSTVGAQLAAVRRLVVLGDAGGGKSTLLRWMATAYLLRQEGSTAHSQLPDVETLPERPWLPVLLRCRDLGEADLCRSFSDFLGQHLAKSELLPEDALVMRAFVLEAIAKGEALLLVDGLDEISAPRVRAVFCQELERTAARYPEAPIVITSRRVGYRDMPYRMGRGFTHGVLAELSREDRNRFARTWIDVTAPHQTLLERERLAEELIQALHSNDSVEQLAGNPMLLTTLALIKRKVGMLSSRRTKLYSEAVGVLLNWNPRSYETIEDEEAIPQLEYLAYEMCRRGVQRLSEEEVLDLLDRFRTEYPSLRAIRRHDSQAFLVLLEARSGLLIKSGWGEWPTVRDEEPGWEFRHLTFQEFLAARALLDQRYPGRDRALCLADQVASLVAPRASKQAEDSGEAAEVPDPWKETVRLLVADCRDNEVDEVLRSIVTPLPLEDAILTARPRSILAACCLIDEPNASEAVSEEVLRAFASCVSEGDGRGSVTTILDATALALSSNLWAKLLKRCLIEEAERRQPSERYCLGGLWGMVESISCRDKDSKEGRSLILLERIRSGDRLEACSAAFAVMDSAFRSEDLQYGILVDALIPLLFINEFERQSASWALGWIAVNSLAGKPIESSMARLIHALAATPLHEVDTRRWLNLILDYADAKKALGTQETRFEFNDYNTPRLEHESTRFPEDSLGTISAAGQLNADGQQAREFPHDIAPSSIGTRFSSRSNRVAASRRHRIRTTAKRPLTDVEVRIRPRTTGRSVEVLIHIGEFASDVPISFDWPTPTSELQERVAAILNEIGRLGCDFADASDIAEEKIRAKALRLAELVPEGLIRTLKTAAGQLETLSIDSFEPWFPWELLWLQKSEGKQSSGRYLADAFEVARWHGDFSPTKDLAGRRIAWVTLDSAKLPAVEKERLALSSIVGAGREIVDAPRSLDALRQAMEGGGFDIWHFAGEGTGSAKGDPDTRGLRLEDYVTLAGEDLLALRGRWRSERPLVFLNACRTGLSGDSFGPARGLPIRFLEAGAGAVLATLWEVSDAFASVFAIGFYKRALTGSSIAKAVRKARLAARMERPGDPSWLAYVLFAHPLSSLSRARSPEPETISASLSTFPTIDRSWTGEKQFSYLIKELCSSNETEFLATARLLLSVIWAPQGEIRFDRFRRLTDRNFIRPSLGPDEPVRAFGFRLFEERGDLLGAEQANLFKPVLERFAVEGPKVDTYLLLTNRIPSATAFREASRGHLRKHLASRAAVVDFWGPQEIVQAAFNAMATRLLQLALTGGIENLERLREGSALPQVELVDQVPLSRSFLVVDQHHLREESPRQNVVADPALALAEARGEHFTVLLGEFGFGKTTVLERAIRAAGDRQVLYLPGAAIDQQVHGTKDLLERLLDLESLWGAREDDEREILRLLARPALQHLFRDPDFPVALAIDGLDEAAYLSRRDGLQQLFNSLANVQVPVVLAMRSEYWNEMEEDFRQISGGIASHGERRNRRIKRIELCDWQPQQIADFLSREIAACSDPTAKDRLEALAKWIDQPEFEAFYGDIPRRPLFLRFIVDAVADEGLPTGRETRVRLFERWVFQKIARDVYSPSKVSQGTSGRKPLVEEGERLSTIQDAAWEAMTCAAAAMCEEKEGRIQLLPSCTLDRALSASQRLRALADPLPLFLHSLLTQAPSPNRHPRRIRFSHRAFQEFFLAWAIHHRPELLPRGEVPNAVRQWVEEIAQDSANLPAVHP